MGICWDTFSEMQIFTFKYLICNAPVFKLRKMDHILKKMWSLWRWGLFTETNLFLCIILACNSTPGASRVSQASKSGGRGGLLPWRQMGANGHIIKSKLGMYKAFVMLILFPFLSKKKKRKKAQIKGQISLIKSNTNLVISEIKVPLKARCQKIQYNKEAQKVAGCQV